MYSLNLIFKNTSTFAKTELNRRLFTRTLVYFVLKYRHYNEIIRNLNFLQWMTLSMYTVQCIGEIRRSRFRYVGLIIAVNVNVNGRIEIIHIMGSKSRLLMPQWRTPHIHTMARGQVRLWWHMSENCGEFASLTPLQHRFVS